GLLGWRLFDRKQTVGTLFLYLLIANAADVDFLLHAVFRDRAVFIHQYYTHNLPFVLAVSLGFMFLLRDGPSRWGLVLTGISHLAADVIVVDTLKPVGIRLFFPISGVFYNLPWFPFLQRGAWKEMVTLRNLAVLGLEFGIFVLPVLLLFPKSLWKRFGSSAFWKV
ncbi:MAG: hypothetical protein GYA74_11750, partial [Acidobacteria bacterium]|nr:hypothetical protein [Acidobacteriota bacterium]